MTLSCFTCKTNFLPAAWQKLRYRETGRVYCGNSTFRIAVEADGPSHGTLARKEQDAKKDALLGLYGWTVLRFSNEEILASPERVRSEVLSLISKWMERTLT